jgi:outer membrane protein
VVAITRAALDQAGETLRQIDAQFQVGNVPEFDVLRAGVARDSQRAALIGAEVQRDLAYLRLKQLLTLPADEALELDVDLLQPTGAPADRWATALANAEAGYQAIERAAVAQAEATVRGTEAAVAIARAQRRPSVSVTSGYIAYAYDRLPAFDRQDWVVTGAVSFPIFDGGRLKASEQIARANVEESAAQARLARQVAELDGRSAYATYRAARATWEASAGTVQQAERAFEIADVRYREGLSTQLELNDARLALERASVDRAQAARDLQMARARLALLPDLPLTPAGPGTGQPSGPPPTDPTVAPRPMTAPLPAGAPGQAAPGGTGASGAPGAR